MGLTANIKDGKIEDKAAYGATSIENKTVKRGTTELGKDAFLQLLVCQMQNQDPLQPTSDTEWIAQLATYSQVEQLQNLNSTTTNTQAFSLVGKTVTMKSIDSSGNSSFKTGVVESITMVGNVANLKIEGELYPITQLDGVTTPKESEEGIDTKAYDLVGNYVIMKTVDEEGTATYTDGRVDYVVIKDNKAYLSVNETLYTMDQITKVVDDDFIAFQNSLIGHTVVLETKGEDGTQTEIQGICESISLKEGETYLSVNGVLYPYSALKGVIVEDTETPA